MEFYAPYYPGCNELAKKLEKVALILGEKKSKLTVAKIDVTKHREIMDRYDIKEYPTLKWFSNRKE